MNPLNFTLPAASTASDIRHPNAVTALRQGLREVLTELSMLEFYESELEFSNKTDQVVLHKHHYELKRLLMTLDWSTLVGSEAAKVSEKQSEVLQLLATHEKETGMTLPNSFTRLGISVTEYATMHKIVQSLYDSGFYYQNSPEGICENSAIYLRLMKSNAALLAHPLTISAGVKRREIAPISLDGILQDDPLSKFYEIDYGGGSGDNFNLRRFMGVSPTWFFVIDKE